MAAQAQDTSASGPARPHQPWEGGERSTPGVTGCPGHSKRRGPVCCAAAWALRGSGRTVCGEWGRTGPRARLLHTGYQGGPPGGGEGVFKPGQRREMQQRPQLWLVRGPGAGAGSLEEPAGAEGSSRGMLGARAPSPPSLCSPNPRWAHGAFPANAGPAGWPPQVGAEVLPTLPSHAHAHQAPFQCPVPLSVLE